MKRELKYVWWKRNYFPHIILEYPRGKNKMCKENGITRADDQFYIVDKSLYIGKMYIYILGYSFLFLHLSGLFQEMPLKYLVFLFLLFFFLRVSFILYINTLTLLKNHIRPPQRDRYLPWVLWQTYNYAL